MKSECVILCNVYVIFQNFSLTNLSNVLLLTFTTAVNNSKYKFIFSKHEIFLRLRCILMFTHISYSCRYVCIYRCHPFADFIAHVRFEVLTVVSLKIQIFWVVVVCCWVSGLDPGAEDTSIV